MDNKPAPSIFVYLFVNHLIESNNKKNAQIANWYLKFKILKSRSQLLFSGQLCNTNPYSKLRSSSTIPKQIPTGIKNWSTSISHDLETYTGFTYWKSIYTYIHWKSIYTHTLAGCSPHCKNSAEFPAVLTLSHRLLVSFPWPQWCIE